VALLTEMKLRAMLRAGERVVGVSDGNGLTWTLSKGEQPLGCCAIALLASSARWLSETIRTSRYCERGKRRPRRAPGSMRESMSRPKNASLCGDGQRKTWQSTSALGWSASAAKVTDRDRSDRRVGRSVRLLRSWGAVPAI